MNLYKTRGESGAQKIKHFLLLCMKHLSWWFQHRIGRVTTRWYEDGINNLRDWDFIMKI